MRRRRVIVAVLILAVILVGIFIVRRAHAAQFSCGTGGSLSSAGYQQLTVSTTATSLTVPAGATLGVMIVETNAIRYRDDGTAPTSAVGALFTANAAAPPFPICGNATLQRAQLIRSSADSAVSILYYK